MKNLKKKLYIAFGFLAVILAIIGVFIPGLPTVPFLLVALFCFERSSKKYHDMIMNNKYFGPVLQDYYSGKGLTLSIKIKAILFLTCGIAFSIYKIQNLHARIALAVVWLGVAIHIILLKTKEKKE
ncbi:MAG: YbaN family protein [Fusobacterium periodonticum]|nr:YbaN family protein [Fusobacterium periodonticum]MDU5804239.1 YbaN family protein [Fusobacterium periodonticum]